MVTMRRADQPNIQLSPGQLTQAIKKFKAANEWAKRYQPRPLLKANPGMSVRQAFEQMLEQDKENTHKLREKFHTETQAEPDRQSDGTVYATRRAEATCARLYDTPYNELEDYERDQLSALLSAQDKDIEHMLKDNPGRSATEMLEIAAQFGGRDIDDAWLDRLPYDHPVTRRPPATGAFMRECVAHRGLWHMWGKPDTPAMSLTHAQELAARTTGLTIARRTRADGTVAVYASYRPEHTS